jgi:UDP-glucose 4-epimerase
MMHVLVTGSSGHLGEALVRTLRAAGHRVWGVDVVPSPFTQVVGSIADRAVVQQCMQGIDAVLHTATLHKPHVVTHGRQAFVDTNITGTLNLLEEAALAKVKAFVFTSTTSAFGRALAAVDDSAAWIDEDVVPLPKNIYGVTKIAAENLCELSAHKQRLPCIVLRTSRFFPEADDSADTRAAFTDANAKANELLYRRGDIEDMVSAHVCALERATAIGFGRYIVSASTPFQPSDLAQLHHDAPAVVARYYPHYAALYAQHGWTMHPRIDRVYDNRRARAALGWHPRYDFAHVLEQLQTAGSGVPDLRSPLAMLVGSKGYHTEVFAHGPFPVEPG